MVDREHPAGTSPVHASPAEVAIVIPTKDRQEFLDEAIDSALRQSHSAKEIIVVDDGSTVPVDPTKMRERHGDTVRVLRNDTNRGLAFSRNRGVEACTSEYVVHLDDDDLLAPDAIEACLCAWRQAPDVEWLMFAVVGFGDRAEHFNTVQPLGVDKVIELAQGEESFPGLVTFDRRLLPALLQTVPSAFQRVMTRTDTWHIVNALRRRVYRLDPSVPDDETANLRITGPLRDSECALYAALACGKTGLVRKPIYLARCEGQGGSSQPAMRMKHVAQSVAMKTAMLSGATKLGELRPYYRDIRQSLATVHFHAAFQLLNLGRYGQSLSHLAVSFQLNPQLRHLKLLAKLGAFSVARRHPVMSA